MPFHFSLGPLERLRRIQEQRERMRLTLLNASRGRLRNEYEEVGRQRTAGFDELEHRLRVGVSGAELRFEGVMLQLTAKRRRELAALIEAMELQIRKQIEAFLESQNKRKILENLRKREWQVFQQIENRREQQRIDDLFAQRHAPRQGG